MLEQNKHLEKSQAWCYRAVIPALKYREKTELGNHGQSRLPETLSQQKIQKPKRN